MLINRLHHPLLHDASYCTRGLERCVLAKKFAIAYFVLSFIWLEEQHPTIQVATNEIA